ncbi:pteridine reductase [Alteromonas aestuariivivens]|uniref:Pteridine reductase n=1 Tax=Alteromonas aestuariivivens TaxID=1938339 RepID=A0A3D8MB93_9ALTE|nr:pteridine reductase [Alteromonas aestuariivivens]RDV27518.1 pteridine reductase [Alteromonas aestuariivivens]
MTVSNPVVLITGAARRIGATLARHMHQAGYRVIIHYQHSASQASLLADELNAQRPNSALTLSADLCDINQVESLAERASTAFGQVDVLVNNASSFYPTPVGNITAQDWHLLVGSNVQGPLFLSQALLPSLRREGGSIINLIDMHIDRPLPKHSVYCLAKSALASLTRSLANELAPAVRVNGIAPGAILWPERELDDAEKNALLATVPLGKLGDPQAIAQALDYLLKADYVTGQILYVDGGRSIMSNASA